MSTLVERVEYGDRTLNRSYDDETGESFEGWSDVAHEAVRAMNHITSFTRGEGIPAPVAYSTLGNLHGLASMLPQLFEQLAGGLADSPGHFDVYDRKGDPADSVADAAGHLQRSRALAAELAAALGPRRSRSTCRATTASESRSWG